MYSEPGTLRIAADAAVNCPKNRPAIGTADKDAPSRPLAMDRVATLSGVLYVNHGKITIAGNPYPRFFNMLYGDGHVAGSSEDAYRVPLSILNYSIQHYTGGPYFYWRK